MTVHLTAKQWGGKKKNKYSAKHTWVCDKCGALFHEKPTMHQKPCGSTVFVHFHSKREANYWVELRGHEKAGIIKNLKRQVKFPIVIDETQVGSYVADFTYRMNEPVSSRFLIVVDVKGHDTKLSAFKRKCVEAQYGIKVEIVK